MTKDDLINERLTAILVACGKMETRLDEIEKKIDAIQATEDKLKEDVATLKMKSAILGGTAGVSVASLVQLVQFLMGHH